MIKQILSLTSGLLFIVGFVPYIRAILRGEAKPAKASWVVWASMDSVVLAGMLAKHAVNGQIIGVILGAWVVVGLALKYGKPGWTWLDKFCLASTATSLVLWKTLHNPAIGVIINLGIGFIGSIPTFRSAWHDPSTENRTAWTVFWASCVIAVIAIPSWTFIGAAQPMTFFMIETIMMYILYVRPRTICRD